MLVLCLSTLRCWSRRRTPRPLAKRRNQRDSGSSDQPSSAYLTTTNSWQSPRSWQARRCITSKSLVADVKEARYLLKQCCLMLAP